MSAHSKFSLRLTIIASSQGPVSKRLALGDARELVVTPAAALWQGAAKTIEVAGLEGAARLLDSLQPTHAVVPGQLVDVELGQSVHLTTKKLFEAALEREGAATIAGVRTRSQRHLEYQENVAGVVLLDFDSRGMPGEMRRRLLAEGGVEAVLSAVFPELEGVGRVVRCSTSAGVFWLDEAGVRQDFAAADGLHILVPLVSVADAPRVLQVMHVRLILAGWGWIVPSASGTPLVRSLVDVSVGGPEHLMFGRPVVEAPLQLDQDARRARVVPGGLWDSVVDLAGVSEAEKGRVAVWLAGEKTRRADELGAVRAAWKSARVTEMVARGVAPEVATRTAERLAEGQVLRPDFVPVWDDGGAESMAEVLADPGRFVGRTMADPVEGVGYGRCKAMVLWSGSGPPIVHSFAHGGMLYRIMHDTESARALLEGIADSEAAIAAYADLVARLGELSMLEQSTLLDELQTRLGQKRAPFKAAVKAALEAVREQDAAQRRERDAAARAKSGRPLIVVSHRIDIMVDKAEEALLAGSHEVYQRGPHLVCPGSIELPAAPEFGRERLVTVAALHPQNAGGMLYHLSAAADFGEPGQFGMALVQPPENVVKALLARIGHWRVPVVKGIATIPLLRHDGSLVDVPGFDVATGYYLRLPRALRALPVPDRPTKDQAVAALRLLRRLLAEFPFVDAISEAVALSALITAVVRTAMSVSPLHGFSAPLAGSGKSYLWDVISGVVQGRFCPVIAVGDVEGEFEKKLNGMLLRGLTLFSIDNVSKPLRGDLLNQAATQPMLDLRALNSSAMHESPSGALIGATGNNLRFAGDMIRRVVRALLDPAMEEPWKREFKGRPFEWAVSERALFLAAVFTIVRGYLLSEANSEPYPVASFETWSRLVRGPLLWLDCADPADSMAQVRAEDPELGALGAMIAAWDAALGVDQVFAASGIITTAMNGAGIGPGDSNAPGYAAAHAAWQRKSEAMTWLREAIEAVALRGRDINVQVFANWLGEHQDRRVAGRMIVGERNKSTNKTDWRLVAC